MCGGGQCRKIEQKRGECEFAYRTGMETILRNVNTISACGQPRHRRYHCSTENARYTTLTEDNAWVYGTRWGMRRGGQLPLMYDSAT
jgi:hypothetical protein